MGARNLNSGWSSCPDLTTSPHALPCLYPCGFCTEMLPSISPTQASTESSPSRASLSGLRAGVSSAQQPESSSTQQPYSHLPCCRSNSEMSFILVQSHMNLLKDAYNAVPFSWRIRDYLEELWMQAQYITDTEGKGTPRPPQGR